MTLVSAIISRARRVNNSVVVGASLTANEEAEGLGLLNSFMLSALGNEAGVELHDINIGGAYDQSQFISSWVPENARLVLNLSAARTAYLDPNPYDGQRVAIADAGANLATRNLTLNGNGRRIETAATVVLSTSSLSRQWMYRADTGNWVRLGEMAASDTLPFPVEFDTYFALELALLLAPQNSESLSKESQAALADGRRKFRARYRRPRQVQDMPAGFLGGRSSSFGLGTADFNAGRAWR